MEGIEEGLAYGRLAKEKEGQNIGPAHVRIAMKCFSAMPGKTKDPEFDQILTAWWNKNIDQKSVAEVALQVQTFQIRCPKTASATWREHGVKTLGDVDMEKEEEEEGKDEEEGESEQPYFKLVICLKDSLFQDSLVSCLLKQGSVLKSGVAPMQPKERELKKLMKSLRK